MQCSALHNSYPNSVCLMAPLHCSNKWCLPSKPQVDFNHLDMIIGHLPSIISHLTILRVFFLHRNAVIIKGVWSKVLWILIGINILMGNKARCRGKSVLHRNLVVALNVQWTSFTAKSEFQILTAEHVFCLKLGFRKIWWPHNMVLVLNLGSQKRCLHQTFLYFTNHNHWYCRQTQPKQFQTLFFFA